MFSNIAKIALFEIKLSIKVCLILRAGQIETSNQNLIPLSDLFQCHRSIGCLRFDKRATVEKLFQGNKLYYIILSIISIYFLRGLYFEN